MTTFNKREFNHFPLTFNAITISKSPWSISWWAMTYQKPNKVRIWLSLVNYSPPYLHPSAFSSSASTNQKLDEVHSFSLVEYNNSTCEEASHVPGTSSFLDQWSNTTINIHSIHHWCTVPVWGDIPYIHHTMHSTHQGCFGSLTQTHDLNHQIGLVQWMHENTTTCFFPLQI